MVVHQEILFSHNAWHSSIIHIWSSARSHRNALVTIPLHNSSSLIKKNLLPLIAVWLKESLTKRQWFVLSLANGAALQTCEYWMDLTNVTINFSTKYKILLCKVHDAKVQAFLCMIHFTRVVIMWTMDEFHVFCDKNCLAYHHCFTLLPTNHVYAESFFRRYLTFYYTYKLRQFCGRLDSI